MLYPHSKRARIGGPDYFEASSLFPEGPRTFAEFFEWPRVRMERFLDPINPGAEDKLGLPSR